MSETHFTKKRDIVKTHLVRPNNVNRPQIDAIHQRLLTEIKSNNSPLSKIEIRWVIYKCLHETNIV